MPVPFLDLKAQYRSIKSEIDPAIQAVIDSCAFALGPAVEKFERDFAAYCGTKYCIGVSDGTAALELAMRAYDIGAGEEVITVANSFFASAEAISLAGATPILVDCNEDDALIDVTKIEVAITKKTKAIIPVHLYGQCADMDAINAIAAQHNLIVIEDACQAHGSGYKGKRAGSIGHCGAFSFYPGKNLGAYGEGGGVTTNDESVALKIRMLRDHGMREKYKHSVIGKNDRLDGIQGAVLGTKLPHLEAWNTKRRAHADLYRKLLGNHPKIKLFKTHADRVHNYHLFAIRVPNRDAVQQQLKDKGIATGIHYPIPIHLQEAYAGKWQKGDFPVAERMADELLSLPMFAEMNTEMVEEVIKYLTYIVK
ncbi:MAG: DegT/DnrJ/EryC1/StrS family aminotransferase [Candidatus Peribacteraceae bacterium]|nr:DegT/DnrJ/EryC1/StrS family aminotransferase [Candidatus Peribacteraceae bacterium]